jgi:hypothetical protein
MASIRPNAEPAATAVQAGDIFLIDGATGVRALAATAVCAVAVGKVAKFNNSLTLAGTDGSTLNVGTGGTLGTSAFTSIGTSGANVPLLNGVNTFSGAQAFTGGLSTTGTVPPNLQTSVGAGVPATSGTTDASQSFAFGNGTVEMRFGVYASGAVWLQPSLISNLASNFGQVLNPNGGNVSIGGQAGSPGTPYTSAGPAGATLLTVGGPIATAIPTTKTANYTQTALDGSLIFNGAASLTLTLLAASSVPGQWLTVKTIAAQTVVSASSNVVPQIGGAAGTAILAGTAGKWARLQSDGTNWIIMESN